MTRILGRNDMEDGLKRLATLTQETASAQVLAMHPADDRVKVIVDKGLDDRGNVVGVDSRGRSVSREATIDYRSARVIIGVQPPSICYKTCFDLGTPRCKRSKGSRAADSQR